MNYAVLLSSGVGTRLGLDIPKQYYEVNNKPIIRYVIETLEKSDVVDAIVLIQDAARPNTSLDTISRCFALAEDEDGAMPVLPMKDTVYASEDGVHLSGLLDRKTIFAGQAPESFCLEKYLATNEALLPEADLKRFCEQFK